MARKLVLLVMVLTGVGLGLAWYFSADPRRSDPGQQAEPPLANGAALPISASAPMAPQSSSNQSPAAPAREPDPLSEPSVVGLRFELSESVRINCQRSEGACNELDVFLERMTAEPRDAPWAQAMEARIERALMSGERGKFRIRALECRSTRCALEVASEVDYVGIQFDADRGFDDIMTPRQGYFAHENDPRTGITTLVSAQVWQTSESFDAEDAMTD